MGYNSPRYIHTLYQAMSLAFADRDFYYGDPAFPPEEPVAGLLSKEYAKQRFAGIARTGTIPTCGRATPIPSRAGRTRSRPCSTRGARCPATRTGPPGARPHRATG